MERLPAMPRKNELVCSTCMPHYRRLKDNWSCKTRGRYSRVGVGAAFVLHKGKAARLLSHLIDGDVDV